MSERSLGTGGRWVIVGLASASALAFVLTMGGGLGYRSHVDLRGSLPLPPGVRTVRIEVASGSVTVATREEPRVDYVGGIRRAADTAEQLAELERLPTEPTAALAPDRPDLLVVTAPRVPPGPGGKVSDLALHSAFGTELTFYLPASLAIEVHVEGSGHLSARERTAPVTMVTGRGDLHLSHCTGPAALKSGGGTTIIDDHRGNLEIDAASGPIQAFVHEPGEQLRLLTGEGDVQCYVPPETGFRLDARSHIGKVANGFGVPMEQIGYSAKMVGSRGDGRTAIVLRTGSGHLSLSHKTWDAAGR